MIDRAAEPNARVGTIESLPRNGLPPRGQIVDVEPHHEIAGKLIIVESLEDELSAAIPKPSIAIVLPDLLETEVFEETPAGLVILAARNEWEQRIRAEVCHNGSLVFGGATPDASRIAPRRRRAGERSNTPTRAARRGDEAQRGDGQNARKPRADEECDH